MLSMAVGLDVSKAKLDVALYRDGQYQLATFSNDAKGQRRLRNWLKKRRAKGCAVCLEATGRYGEAVAQFLHEAGYAVSVVNPARIKAYGQSQLKRNKTDLEDAKVIAHFCATQEPALWTPPPPEVQELQALVSRLRSLTEDRTRELNRQQSAIPSQTVRQDVAEHIAFLDERIAAVKQSIDDLLDQHPDLRQQRDLLTSIPGIGDTTAAQIIASVPDVSRFDSAGQLAAYAGLTPRQHHSGSSVHRRSRLAKTGNTRFRTALYMPALAAMRHNPIIRALVERLQARGKRRMVIVGAVMRKLVHLAYGVLKNKTPFDPHYVVNMPATV